MKKIYKNPVLELEYFNTEAILDNTNPENVLSYDLTGVNGGYDSYIQFQNGDANTLNKVDYNDFIAP